MQIHKNIEQGSDAWYQLRAGKATASVFSKLVTPAGKPSKSLGPYARLLAAEDVLGRSLEQFSGNASTERGNELEPEARNFYEFTTSSKVEEVAFITNDAGTAGCSPDSLVGGDGLLEIKCPMEQKFMDCLVHIHEGKCPPDYWIQVQAQMFISEREWCDLLVYHPELPSKPVRVFPDKGLHKLFKEQLEEVQRVKEQTIAMLTDQKEAA